MTESQNQRSTRQDHAEVVDLAGETLGGDGTLAERVEGHMTVFADKMREGLLAASTAVGLEVMAEMMETETAEIAGPKGKHDPDRTAKRHGTTTGAVVLGGRRVPVERPRVREVDHDDDGGGEIPLETYTTFADTDQLAAGIVSKMMAGLSTRRYADAGLEPVGERLEADSIGKSKSAVSRRFVAATSGRLDEIVNRRLDEDRWLVIFLDGFGFGDHTLVGALGVTADGVKVPLAVVEGDTENKIVCTRLLAGLAERGLDASGGILFCVNGSLALSSAIGATFGEFALIQRCRRHKERNIEGHLPERKRREIRDRLRAAWATRDADLAERELEAIARGLAKAHPGAAASIREGLAETVTVNRLGVEGLLLKTLESTNPVESMIEIVRDHSRRVKRWRDGEMALRWAAAGMICAQRQFRRIRGHNQLGDLERALREATAKARRSHGVDLAIA